MLKKIKIVAQFLDKIYKKIAFFLKYLKISIIISIDIDYCNFYHFS